MSHNREHRAQQFGAGIGQDSGGSPPAGQALDPIAQVRADFANFPNEQEPPPEEGQQQEPEGPPPFSDADLAMAARLGITPAQLEGFRLLGPTGLPTNQVNWNAVETFFRLNERARGPEAQPRTIEELIVGAIQDDNIDKAISLDDFRRRPSSTEALQTALDFATSPADVFTLSAFARGQGQMAPPSREEGVRSLPRPPLTQQLFEQFAQDALGQGQLGQEAPQQPAQQQAQPPGGQERPREQPSAQLQRSSGGLAGDFSAQVGQPEQMAQPRVGGPRQRPQSPEPQTATTESPLFRTPGQGEPLASALSEQQLAGLTPEQQEFVQSRQAGGGLLPTPEQEAGLVPEGTPTGTIQFNGQDRPIPVGLEPLFGGEAVDRPGTLLGQAGLPLPSQQSLRNMTSGERASFVRLAEEAGIPRADLQSELESVLPAPSRRRRTTTAARRANG